MPACRSSLIPAATHAAAPVALAPGQCRSLLADLAHTADHPVTAWSLNNLAAVLHAQGDLQGARTLFERALAIREARLGADHPATVRIREQLAAVVAALENRQ